MNVYAYIIPVVLVLLLLEIAVCVFRNNGIYKFQDTVTNLATGIANQCVNIAVVTFVFIFYGWLDSKIPWSIETSWYSMLGLLVLSDFVFYWFHRTGHSINIFWAAHMPHHSSEEFNLSVGIRASFTQRIFQFAFFDWVLVIFGFSPEQIYAVAGIHLLLAYWHHTQLIPKLGLLEYIFVTPSHHRVHHGVNPQYIDKNFSEFLIIWDRLFGSHEEEIEEVCYGITHPPRTWDPIFINIQFWKQLWDDACATQHWWDKLRLWFMPLGWRPADLRGDASAERIGYTRKDQVKWTSLQPKRIKPYLVVQIALALVFLAITVDLQNNLSLEMRALMSAGVFMMIIAWGGLLQAKPWALLIECMRWLYMAGMFIWALYQLDIGEQMIPAVIIAVSLLAAGSLLVISLIYRSRRLEGVAFNINALGEGSLAKN